MSSKCNSLALSCVFNSFFVEESATSGCTDTDRASSHDKFMNNFGLLIETVDIKKI